MQGHKKFGILTICYGIFAAGLGGFSWFGWGLSYGDSGVLNNKPFPTMISNVSNLFFVISYLAAFFLILIGGIAMLLDKNSAKKIILYGVYSTYIYSLSLVIMLVLFNMLTTTGPELFDLPIVTIIVVSNYFLLHKRLGKLI